MIFNKVREVLVHQLDVPEENITEESLLVEDLGADSLDVVDIIMCLEEEFDISISDEEVEHSLTVGDVARYIDNLLE